jgi:hypothetical protein
MVWYQEQPRAYVLIIFFLLASCKDAMLSTEKGSRVVRCVHLPLGDTWEWIRCELRLSFAAESSQVKSEAVNAMQQYLGSLLKGPQRV